MLAARSHVLERESEMHLRRRLTFANVCSASALAVALGLGSANAAGLIGTAQLRDGAVTTPKLAPQAVTASRVRPHSLGAGVFAPGTLLRGPRGASGASVQVIDVPYTAELTTGTPTATLTYPIPAGSWLVTTSVSIVSAGGPTGNLPTVRCEGPQDRDGLTPHVVLNTNTETWGNTWQVTSPVVATGTGPEPTIWECTMFGSSSANVKMKTLLQRVGGFS